jgi:hypothetical protein
MDAYFGPLERERSVKEGSPECYTSESERHRRATSPELTHLAYIAGGKWEQFWDGKLGSSLKGMSMNVVFFHFFALNAIQTGGAVTVRTYALASFR